MKTYVINRRGKINGITRYCLSLCENGKVQHELTYHGESGKRAANRDGKEWMAGKLNSSNWFGSTS